jgi:hypothetical protein
MRIYVPVPRRPPPLPPLPVLPLCPPLPPLPAVKKQLVSCQSCEAFLTDWLRLPPHHGHPWVKRLKWHALQRCAPFLAKELYRFMMSITGTEEYVIKRTVQIRLKFEESRLQQGFIFIRPPLTPEQKGMLDRLAWNTLIHAIVTQRREYGKDLDYMRAYIQDAGMIYSDADCLEWLGYCIWTVWNEVVSVHKEHLGLKEPEGGGPAFGLFSIRASVADPHT